MGRRERTRLANGLTASAIFVFGAAVLWVIAAVSSWSGNCPDHPLIDRVGLDKEISAWPPGAQCIDHSGDLYIYEAQPWVKPMIAALLACAAVILLVALVAAIRDSRSYASGFE